MRYQKGQVLEYIPGLYERRMWVMLSEDVEPNERGYLKVVGYKVNSNGALPYGMAKGRLVVKYRRAEQWKVRDDGISSVG